MQNKYPRFENVKGHASGRWDSILAALGYGLAHAIERVPRHVACPVHGGRDGFRLFRDYLETGGGCCNTCGTFADGFALLAWLNGWTNIQTLHSVALYVNDHSINCPVTLTSKSIPGTSPTEILRNRQNIIKTWAKTLSAGKPLQHYLVNRGLGTILDDLPQVLRFHPSLALWENGKKLGQYPTMVANVQAPDGQQISLHRTFITSDGYKAPVITPRKLMPPAEQSGILGAAIRLFPPEEGILAVAEGLETAMAVRVGSGLPVWSCISALGLERIILPPDVHHVIIMGDLDKSGTGQKAAHMLGRRLLAEGRTVKVVLPPGLPEGYKSIDWLDILNGGRCNG